MHLLFVAIIVSITDALLELLSPGKYVAVVVVLVVVVSLLLLLVVVASTLSVEAKEMRKLAACTMLPLFTMPKKEKLQKIIEIIIYEIKIIFLSTCLE
jgi:hypothetical protein